MSKATLVSVDLEVIEHSCVAIQELLRITGTKMNANIVLNCLA